MEFSLQAGRCEGYGWCEETAPRVYRRPDEADVPSEPESEEAAGVRVGPVADPGPSMTSAGRFLVRASATGVAAADRQASPVSKAHHITSRSRFVD
jgi:ferredoxin